MIFLGQGRKHLGLTNFLFTPSLLPNTHKNQIDPFCQRGTHPIPKLRAMILQLVGMYTIVYNLLKFNTIFQRIDINLYI